ncbi:MAG: hypothetical protein H7062_01670 [Candidatus Saccharimonas sp.]|nr:hypothetical protein [Planctomycetaceae bacterium]
MPRLTAKKAVRKKITATSRKSTTKKSVTKRPVKASVRRPNKTAKQPIAPDGNPWPQLPGIFGHGNLTAKQVREVVLRAMAAVGIKFPVEQARKYETTRIKRTKK